MKIKEGNFLQYTAKSKQIGVQGALKKIVFVIQMFDWKYFQYARGNIHKLYNIL